jgi:transposase
LEQICQEVGVVLAFLPPYSPDLNPIEEAFAELKAWMRKNYTLQENYMEFEGFLEAGLRHMANKAGNHFRSSHIVTPLQE